MTKSSFAEIAIKIWAITLLVPSLLGLPSMVAKAVVVGAQVVLTFEFVDFALVAALAVALLMFARPIAERLARPDHAAEDVHDTRSLQVVGFGCVGLYFAVLGLRDCLGLLFELVAKPSGESYLWQGAPQQLIPAVVQMVAGTAIFLARKRLASVSRERS
jgi:membrane protein implicated in regulation of membrane protease activity